MKSHLLFYVFALVAIAFVFAFDASAGMLIAPAAAVSLEDLPELAKRFKQTTESVEARLHEFGQKLSRRGGDGYLSHSAASPGEILASSEEFKALTNADRGRASVSIKATLTLGAGSAGALVDPQRVGDGNVLPRRRVRFREVLAAGRTDSSSVEFVRQLTRTNAAATVAETLAKPEAALTYELATAPVRTIAVTLPASRQVLSDSPMLRSMVDQELLYMLQDVEEQQLLNGDGVGSNVLGIVPQATAFAPPFAITSPTSIDMLLQAIAQLEAADFDGTFIGLNPLDWRRIQSLKDSQGRYLANGPFSADQVERLWSLPIVPTKAIPVDKFLVGDGQRGAQVFDRWQARVEVSTEHLDFFAKNLVLLLAEERLALATYRPNAFIYGDFGLVV